MYANFSLTPECHLEFQNLVEIVETKALIMFWNVKTCWISLLALLDRIMGEYKSLLANMFENPKVKEPEVKHKQMVARESTRRNYDFLCDLSNDFCWTDSCYQEVVALGDASGVHFTEFIRRRRSCSGRRECCALHPLEIESDLCDADSSGSTSFSARDFDCTPSSEIASSQDSSPGPESSALETFCNTTFGSLGQQ
ncbi:hypothetical protein KC19_VG147400 [Ceratodon purpureus]|uniref:Uncharacterized protein n=1 Tax=Ceratodon purpureus TaxID=3225 RepID=A0A8T0HR98_CERPU|nr:hypothetical protein KC19_VG147400 [Ceratodon purpureus]